MVLLVKQIKKVLVGERVPLERSSALSPCKRLIKMRVWGVGVGGWGAILFVLNTSRGVQYIEAEVVHQNRLFQFIGALF